MMAGAIDEAEEESTLESLKEAAELLVQLEEIIEDLEEELKSVTSRYKLISEVEIPNIMGELGMKTFTLEDGTSLKIADFMMGSLPKEEAPFEQAVKWLTDNDLGSILKTDVNLKFNRGEEEEAQKAVDILEEEGFTVNKKFSAHPQTLYSAIREYDKKAESPAPYELLGLIKGKKTKVKKG